ncbi:bifunctional 2-C-methyl-D-erythritol 4-phosphate cytidylyltransferase/2-C-methyl-D-erythritol 2,4-cyclodiphosphate synthase [Sphingomonas hankyongi]|uniref:Bifunctional enzyme IspD/IspF n=1 Tax=Sphingomonas hankyongi TaxID=2908209 RepID=A0ABT0S3N1_9SPHN|nr:bifunctional 2-C-methyl-D-erythritol 4-phosphate cytidylyltransferase/2-C-methyl-D-erythritol 2,4-cyclodiphosphate synthase [Sphingomonas hankyongi]MCL6730469.1 bifunctional 2-C-methyl-D-erythritol 4-phosphate cytidylyltransferase/2-C-methyl-D-erythritol 2,4-cyclodiphosphate synthase [Sphingomonas hankyongi]
MSVTALIVAAGSGQRMGGDVPKQYRRIAGKPILRWAAEALLSHPAVRRLRVIVGDGQDELAGAALSGLNVGDLITGGQERSDSVRAGLRTVDDEAVLIHDAARPFCPPAVIDRLLPALEFYEGAAPVMPVGDTLARSGDLLGEPLDRTGIVRVQTPQLFRLESLRRAYDLWEGPSPTDETTVLRAAGMSVASVPGDPALEKLTTAADFERAQAWLAGTLVSRTGSGFDVHAFGGAGPVTLGGIAIPHSRGLAGHSDADVVLHAITDALLGAGGLGDIGDHFPPSDPQWKGADSELFLSHAASLLRSKGAIIDHVDCTVIAEEPKVKPHRSAMRDRIASILEIAVEQVSVKATTTEGLGFTGRREGIACSALASIRMGSPR